MIALRIPPLSRGQDLRHNLPLLPPLLLDLLGDFSSSLLLSLVVVEDTRAVLATCVWTLTVHGRGVMHLVEEFEDGLVGDFGRVVDYLACFCVCLSYHHVKNDLILRTDIKDDLRPVDPLHTAR